MKFQKLVLFLFLGKETSNLVDLLNRAILNYWVPYKQ